MAHFDLVIRGGTVATAVDTFTADVGIRDGRIVALGDSLSGADATREIDATGRWVLPGGIEAHCHIEQESSMGIMTADDYWLPLEQQYVTMDSAVVQWSDFAHDHGISYKTLKRFNPWLRSADLSNPLKQAYEIAMPVTDNQGEQLPADHD